MARIKRWVVGHKTLALLWGIALFAVGVAAFAGIARATDQPVFCGSACHEMSPYHTAWTQGPHKNVSCIECHVDDGTTARLLHKMEALKEVYAHVANDPTFPLAETTRVPNERCQKCHSNVESASPGFSHADHAARGDCQSCHYEAGHEVGANELRKAGIYNSAARRKQLSGQVASVDGGAANLPGHKVVACERCHDMAKTGCASCHTPRHKPSPAKRTDACTTCHAPGASFVFAHPTTRDDCASCHTAPAQKHAFDGECTTCHKTAGMSWAFKHTDDAGCTNCHARPAQHRPGACTKCHQPGDDWTFRHRANSSCTDCHTRPAGHRTGACTTCHSIGKSWSFNHPGSKATCTSCHAKPAGHRSGSCTGCHSTGKSWAFRHPGAKASCASCHARPSGHRSGSCTTCHSVGRSWAFRHPGAKATCTSCHNRPGGHSSGQCSSCHSTSSWKFNHSSSSSCASCHKAPSGHYGSSCSSCHSPSRSWSSATFSHPRVPGGKHNYRSFACANCHPNGYSSYSCAKCHESASGPRDDD